MKCKEEKYRLISLRESEMDTRECNLNEEETIEPLPSERATTSSLPEDMDAKMNVSLKWNK